MAVWRRPKLTARGDPDHDDVVAGIMARLGRRCAADFIALLQMLAQPFPLAPVIAVITRYSPHDNPAERIWGALKNYVANTAVS